MDLQDQDYELLSAYLDGLLTNGERAALEQRLAVEPLLRAELAALRQTVTLVRSLPARKAPRNFVLTPALIEAAIQPVSPRSTTAPGPRPVGASRIVNLLLPVLSAAASLLLVLFGAGLLLLSNAPARQPATINDVMYSADLDASQSPANPAVAGLSTATLLPTASTAATISPAGSLERAAEESETAQDEAAAENASDAAGAALYEASEPSTTGDTPLDMLTLTDVAGMSVPVAPLASATFSAGSLTLVYAPTYAGSDGGGGPADLTAPVPQTFLFTEPPGSATLMPDSDAAITTGSIDLMLTDTAGAQINPPTLEQTTTLPKLQATDLAATEIASADRAADVQATTTADSTLATGTADGQMTRETAARPSLDQTLLFAGVLIVGGLILEAISIWWLLRRRRGQRIR